jgi:hypothetical protein
MLDVLQAKKEEHHKCPVQDVCGIDMTLEVVAFQPMYTLCTLCIGFYRKVDLNHARTLILPNPWSPKQCRWPRMANCLCDTTQKDAIRWHRWFAKNEGQDRAASRQGSAPIGISRDIMSETADQRNPINAL